MATVASGFEVIEHPADMGFRCWAGDINELYAVAALSLLSVIVDVESIPLTETVSVELEAFDRETLMYNWLSEVLYYFDGERTVLSNFEVKLETASDKIWLRATMQGGSFDPEQHRVKTYVKAITFHQMEIEESSEGCRAQIYLDI